MEPSNFTRSAELDRLTATAYVELQRLARGYFSRERLDHTLEPTALVNEAYLRLADQKHGQWQSRAHFLGVAALLMRRILREHARKRSAGRRGGGAGRVILEDTQAITGGSAVEFLAVDEALNGLTSIDPEAAKVVELRFFGGLSIEETSVELGLSAATVKRHWTVARAYLIRQLRDDSV